MRSSLVIPLAVIPLVSLGVAGCVDVHNPPPQTPAAAIVTPGPTYTAPSTTTYTTPGTTTYTTPGSTTYVSPGATTTVGPGGTTTVQQAY
jgi:hypothetical protein